MAFHGAQKHSWPRNSIFLGSREMLGAWAVVVCAVAKGQDVATCFMGVPSVKPEAGFGASPNGEGGCVHGSAQMHGSGVARNQGLCGLDAFCDLAQ